MAEGRGSTAEPLLIPVHIHVRGGDPLRPTGGGATRGGEQMVGPLADAVAARLQDQLIRMEGKLEAMTEQLARLQVARGGADDGDMQTGQALQSTLEQQRAMPKDVEQKSWLEALSASMASGLQMEGPLAHVRWLSTLASSNLFNLMSILVILMYTTALWLSADANAVTPKVDFVMVGHLLLVVIFSFGIYFTLELVLQVLVYGRALFGSVWFWIDLCSTCANWVDFCSALGIIPWYMITLPPRVVRTARVFRIFSLNPELSFMMSCVIRTVPTLMWAVLLLGFCLVVLALLLTELMSEFRGKHTEYSQDPQISSGQVSAQILELFGSVHATALHIFQALTGGSDWPDLYNLVALTGPIPRVVFVSVYVFFEISALNVITSIFVNRSLEVVENKNNAAALTDMGREQTSVPTPPQDAEEVETRSRPSLVPKRRSS